MVEGHWTCIKCSPEPFHVATLEKQRTAVLPVVLPVLPNALEFSKQ